jgi:hypothetical protein
VVAALAALLVVALGPFLPTPLKEAVDQPRGVHARFGQRPGAAAGRPREFRHRAQEVCLDGERHPF